MVKTNLPLKKVVTRTTTDELPTEYTLFTFEDGTVVMETLGLYRTMKVNQDEEELLVDHPEDGPDPYIAVIEAYWAVQYANKLFDPHTSF